MAEIRVNPTRMELKKLQGRYTTARRGHKLLKDKRDELMKQFLETVREVRALRAEVEEELMESMDPRVQEARLLLNRKTVKYKPIPRFRSGCKNC